MGVIDLRHLKGMPTYERLAFRLGKLAVPNPPSHAIHLGRALGVMTGDCAGPQY